MKNEKAYFIGGYVDREFADRIKVYLEKINEKKYPKIKIRDLLCISISEYIRNHPDKI